MALGDESYPSMAEPTGRTHPAQIKFEARRRREKVSWCHGEACEAQLSALADRVSAPALARGSKIGCNSCGGECEALLSMLDRWSFLSLALARGNDPRESKRQLLRHLLGTFGPNEIQTEMGSDEREAHRWRHTGLRRSKTRRSDQNCARACCDF
jgi:hypothetical protein